MRASDAPKRRSPRGAVTTEYAALIATIGLALIAALAAASPRLAADYTRTTTIIGNVSP